MRRRLFAVLLISCVLLLGISHPAQAADRSWDWTRWDVVISKIDTTKNVFHVAETQVIQVTSGSFAGGDRGVDLGRVTGIDNIVVRDGSTTLKQVNASSADNCPNTPGIFCVFTTSDNQRDIYYNFLARTYAGQTRTMYLDYDVHGALRSYSGGDQLWWSPLASNRDFYVYASTVTVQMPPTSPIEKMATYGPNWSQSQSGNDAIFKATGVIGLNDQAEIRIQYPHNTAMAAPAWQAAFDREQELIDRLGPIGNLILVILAALLAIGGPLFVYIQYATHGRDPNPVVVPEYLTEPPSDDPPGLVGTLVDEQADLVDIMATLVDLARRGYLVIEQDQHHGLFDHSAEFIFHRTEPAPNPDKAAEPESLRLYESLLLDGIFRGTTTRKLSELRDKFYTSIPTIKSNLYVELVRQKYFTQSPEETRGCWATLGGGLVVVSGIGFFALISNASKLPLFQALPLLPAPLIGLGIAGIAMLLASRFMPAKTPLGAQESAKWKAFRQYLRHIDKYTDVQQASDQFEKYIGYAVAFGLDKQWIHQFAPVLTSMPTWYYPTYLGGPWHGGYSSYRTHGIGGSGGDMFGMSGPGNMTGGLNSMSNNLTQGLNAMSSGLTSLLNSASSVMTSHPSSSGSGGFSGGGSHGGGSSGGGHAGGH